MSLFISRACRSSALLNSNFPYIHKSGSICHRHKLLEMAKGMILLRLHLYNTRFYKFTLTH